MKTGYIFAGNMNINFETIQKFYDSINKESLEVNFCVGRILKDTDDVKKFIDAFALYQSNLVKYNIVKNDESIYNDINFKVP